MAWDKNLIAEGIYAPDLNDEIRLNWAALEAALTKEMNFATGGTASLQGILKQGGARCFAQAAAPTTRVDGSAFASTDLGMLWIDTDNNKFYHLTAITPTWTPISTEIIALLVAQINTWALVQTFTSVPVFSKGLAANNAYLAARNTAGDGNVDLIKADGSDVPTVPDDTANASSGAPTADASLANKKYVDDQIDNSIGQSSQAAGTSNITNTAGDWADMTDMSITITTKGGNVLLLFSTSYKEASNERAETRFDVDGTSHHVMPHTGAGSSATEECVSLQWLETSLAASAHTFKVQWKDAAGTARQNGATYPRIFTAIEIPS